MMKTQISRNSFDADKRYSAIYQQMGRMLTDADWNELADIGKHRLAEALTHAIGKGSPRKQGLMEVTSHADGSKTGLLMWGYAVVDGVQAEVRPDPAATLNDPNGILFEYQHQRDFPNPPSLPETPYRLYLDVWDRTVITLEDQELRDPGLGGADTCTRSQTMAQVKWCDLSIDPEDPNQNPAIGDARATLDIRQGSTEPDPCDPCAEEIALQDKLGNYLFRIEVHNVDYDNSGAPQRVILKWSSENGAEQYNLTDQPAGFASANWAYEFIDGYNDPDAAQAETYDSEKHLGRHFAAGAGPVRGQMTAGYPDPVPAGYTAVRRWDGYCALEKSGGQWTLMEGFDRGVSLSTLIDAQLHGYFAPGATVVVNHNTMTMMLELADHPMLAGDFWYALVRQSVHVAGDNLLADARPQGIVHHYMTLGQVDAGVLTPYEDDQCKRFEFPPLTDIRADDVCYDPNDCDDMPDVRTVQEAITHLCQEKDLRFHNKHLHGWGIVCGLIVRCGPDTYRLPGDDRPRERRQVRVTEGYAITCEGHDLQLKEDRVIDLMDKVEELEQQDTPILEDGNGTVCLRLERGKRDKVRIRVEPYDPEELGLESLLEGTLLWDFVQNCFMDLFRKITAEFDFLNQDELEELEGGPDGLVSKQRMKFISFFNLIIQLVNQDNGGYVFLSHREHLVLRDIYLNLRKLLQSKTFCGMFKGQAFPEYPFPDTGMTTFFGKNLHTKMKIHPDGRTLYTYGGTDNTINVYDIEKQRLVQVVEMPAAEGAEVSAIAFSSRGNLLYAAANVRSVDSVFGIARINDKHTWEEMTVLCDIEISQMQTDSKDQGLIYAIGQGRGLFLLRPDMLMDQEKPQPEPAFAFNAFGNMEIDESLGLAYCTAAGQEDGEGEVPDSYDRIAVCNLRGDDGQFPAPQVFLLTDSRGNPMQGDDDLALRPGLRGRLYVVVDGVESGSKTLLTYNTPLNPETAKQVVELSIEDTSVHLAYHSEVDQVILAMEDGYRLQLVDGSGQGSKFFRVPVQVQPDHVLVAPRQGDVFTLNYMSNTVSRIPLKELAVDDKFLEQLASYRIEILQAFYALFGGLLQYLKDCFCDHLLVKCPECKKDDVIYLATVEIRDKQVYNICNFDKRKYVKSFPTMGYWLSLVPVWPLLKAFVGQFCCMVLPDAFDRRRDDVIRPSSPGNVTPSKNNVVKAKSARSGLRTYQKTDVRAEFRNQVKTLDFIGNLAGDRVTTEARKKRKKSGVRKQALMQSNLNEAMTELKHSNIEVVGVKKYDSRASSEYLDKFTRTPQRIPPGSKVTLYQREGKVAFYALEDSATVEGSGVSATREELQQLEKRKSRLADFSDVQAELAKAESRRAQIESMGELKVELTELGEAKMAMQDELAALKSQVASVKQMRDSLQDDLASLNTGMKDLLDQQNSLRVDAEKQRPVNVLSGVGDKMQKDLTASGIVTLGDLAATTPAKLSKSMKLGADKAKELIKRAKDRLK